VFSTEDTIVAIATPPGRGGIGVVRLSGANAHAVAVRLTTHPREYRPRHATLTLIRAEIETIDRGSPRDASLEPSIPNGIDQAVVTYFPAPHSYTGEDVVEISAHGSPVILERIVTLAVQTGARLAEPGEFTLRAFLNGRIDLPQAEAVADLVDAVTPLQARTAFDQLHGTLTSAIAQIDATLFDMIARLEASVDFPDEGYHFIDRNELRTTIGRIRDRVDVLLLNARSGRLIREGLTVAIVGPPNVGKSSLFNALVGTSRAIVTSVPGTTRDLVTETIDLAGLKVRLVDTAGLHDTDDIVEAEGVARAEAAAAAADLVLIVRDTPDRVADYQIVENKTLNVFNKADLHLGAAVSDAAVAVSAKTGEGLISLKQQILRALDVDSVRDSPALTNIRHIALLARVGDALSRSVDPLIQQETPSEEFVLADLQEARSALDEVVGRRTPDDVLAHIFERFCIGK
jgi:tRNA modification GTPase